MTNRPFPFSNEETDPRLLEALRILNQISNSINHIGADDSSPNDFSLQLIVNSAIHVVPGSSAVIYTYDQASGTFEKESRLSAAPEGRNHPSAVDHPDDAPRPDGIGMRTLQRRQRSLSYEEPDLDVHPYHAALGVRAVACFPLIVASQAVGILYIYLYEERQFTQLEQLMLNNFVNQAAMAIYHARRLEDVKHDLVRKEEELNQLRRAGLLISSRLRLEETLDSILQLALEITHAQYGIFRLLDKDGKYLVTSAVHGLDLERPLVEKLPLDGNSIMALVARQRQPLLVADLQQEPWSNIYYPLELAAEDALRAGRAVDQRQRAPGGCAQPGKPPACRVLGGRQPHAAVPGGLRHHGDPGGPFAGCPAGGRPAPDLAAHAQGAGPPVRDGK